MPSLEPSWRVPTLAVSPGQGSGDLLPPSWLHADGGHADIGARRYAPAAPGSPSALLQPVGGDSASAGRLRDFGTPSPPPTRPYAAGGSAVRPGTTPSPARGDRATSASVPRTPDPNQQELKRRLRQAEAQMSCARSHIAELESEIQAANACVGSADVFEPSPPGSVRRGESADMLRAQCDALEAALRERDAQLEAARSEHQRDRRLRAEEVASARETADRLRRDLGDTRGELAERMSELARRTGQLEALRSQVDTQYRTSTRLDDRATRRAHDLELRAEEQERRARDAELRADQLQRRVRDLELELRAAEDDRDRERALREGAERRLREHDERLEAEAARERDKRELLERQLREREEKLMEQARVDEALAEHRKQVACLNAQLEDARRRRVAQMQEVLGANTRRGLLSVCFHKLQGYRNRSSLDAQLHEQEALLRVHEGRAEQAESSLREAERLLSEERERAAAYEEEAARLSQAAHAAEREAEELRDQLRLKGRLVESLRAEAGTHGGTADQLRQRLDEEAARRRAIAGQRQVAEAEAGARGRVWAHEEHRRTELLILAQDREKQGSIGMECRETAGRLEIVRTAPQGPADRAGLQPGDRLLFIRRPVPRAPARAPDAVERATQIQTPKSLKDALHPINGIYAASRVTVGYERAGKQHTCDVILEQDSSAVVPTMRKILARLRATGQPRHTFERLDVERLIVLQTHPEQMCRELHRVFRDAARSDSGELSFADFQRAARDLEERVLRAPGLVDKARLRAGFERLDRDGNGRLDFFEFFPIFRRVFLETVLEHERQAECLGSPQHLSGAQRARPQAGPAR